MSALLEVRGLTTTFPIAGARVPIVDGVDLDLERGRVLALVGESGSGKSMTALSVLRLVPRPGLVASGSVRLEGQELTSLPVSEMRSVRGRRIAMIFQEPMTSLNPVVRVGQQVVEAIRLHEDVSKAAALERCRDLFHQVGIPDPDARLRVYPHQLSGGLKQRVMIAMALSARPAVLIADEPTTALDVTIQAQIVSLLRRLQRDSGMSILLITHDLGIVNELADRVAVMYAGRVVELADRETLLSRAVHPYTEGLLRSMPARTPPGERLPEIPGVVPSPGHWPEGCRFASRCEARFAPCTTVEPIATHLAGDHVAHCHAVERDLGPGGASAGVGAEATGPGAS
jgi:oligopeptide/dipeptide ABC transporter ATP-binding protein